MTFPAIILPAFIGAALLLAMLSRRRSLVPAIGCAALAVWLAPRDLPAPQEETTQSGPCIEVDMLVSRGNAVELFLNDWQHPPERLPVVAGQRHVYRFTKIPQIVTLLRLDPTDVPDARLVIYSISFKAGGRVWQEFGPGELKSWNLHEISSPHEEEGGLAMLDTGDDPILWSRVNVRLPAPVAVRQDYWASLCFGILALGLATASLPAFTGRKKRWPVPRGAGVVMVLVVAAGAVWVQDRAAETGVGIEVDMRVSRGHGVDLWCNDWLHAPETLPVVAGQRHVYRFTKLPQHIRVMRLDPSDLPDARVVIYGVAIRSRSRVFQQFGPAELKTWTRTNLSAPTDEDGGVALTGLNDDPILVAPLSLQLPGNAWTALSGMMDTNDGPFLLAIAGVLLALLLRTSTRGGRMQAVMIALSSCAAFPMVWLVVKLSLLPPPRVTVSAGYASYSGYGKANEYLASLLAMLVCVALGWAFAKFTGQGEEVDDTATAPATRRRYVWSAHAVVVSLIFLHFLPNLREILGALGGVVYQYDGWDQSLALHWTEMLSLGMRPLRDFWYPYSGGFIQVLPFPAGVLWWAFHSTVLLATLYLVVFKVTGRRLAHALAIFGLILMPVLLELVPGWNRYLLSVTLALFYAAICEAPRLDWKQHVPFALFVGYAFFYEPTQILYAGVGIAVHTALSVRRGVLKQRLVCVGLPMLAGITASLLFYAANGMLPGLWSFEMSLGDQADYGAYPADIVRWVEPVLQPETVFLVMFLLVSYATYRWVLLKKGRPDPLGTSLMVLCWVSITVMQKQIMRPHVMTQMRVVPYVAMLVFGLIIWREHKAATRLAIVTFVGCILGIAVHRQLLSGIFKQDIAGAPQKVRDTVSVLWHDQVSSLL